MNRLLVKLTMAMVVGSPLVATLASAQESPTTRKAAKVRLTRPATIERADPDFAIVRWTTNNPGGSPIHVGVVRYGLDPKDLSQTATSPVTLNPGHPQTVFRVRVNGLKPKTTYYFTVGSMESNGKDDAVKSAVKRFTTPRALAP